MALFKRKSETTISWYLTNDMKPNVKYYDKNYDKKTALINFLIRNKVSMDLIDQVMLEENPFWLVYKSFKEIGVSEKIHNGQNVEEEKLEFVCDVNKVKKVITELRKVHPYEEPAIDIIPLIDESEFM